MTKFPVAIASSISISLYNQLLYSLQGQSPVNYPFLVSLPVVRVCGFSLEEDTTDLVGYKFKTGLPLMFCFVFY